MPGWKALPRRLGSLALSKAPLHVLAWLNQRFMLAALARAAPSGDSRLPALLFFNHYADQDALALADAAGELRVVVLDVRIAFRISPRLFPTAVRDLTGPYESSPKGARQLHYDACRRMLMEARKRWGVAAIAATSDSFYWYRECLSAALDLGMRRVIIDKEGTISPEFFEEVPPRLRANAPYASDRVYVWSRRQGEFWKRVGAPPSHVMLVGQARSDLLFRPERIRLPLDIPDGPLATFFCFPTDAYVPRGRPNRDRAWWNLRDQCLDALAAAARRAPHAFFVVKLHPQDPAEGYCKARLAGIVNVQVRRDSSTANALLVHSRAIVAFQTTATIEAGPLGRPILYPGWDPLEIELSKALLPLRTMGHVVTLESPKELEDRLVDALRDAPTFPTRIPPVSNDYLERSDGHVCERIIGDVRQLLA